VARSLFKVPGNFSDVMSATQAGRATSGGQPNQYQKFENQSGEHRELDDMISKDLAHGMHDMKMEGNASRESGKFQGFREKERVSFGTNMSMDDESSDSGSMEQKDSKLMMTVECFHASKFKD
jgi:hypothetical protein